MALDLPEEVVLKVNSQIDNLNLDSKNSRKLVLKTLELYLFIEREWYTYCQRHDYSLKHYVYIKQKQLLKYDVDCRYSGGKKYRGMQLVKILEDAGVVEINHNFKPGFNSKSFRINSKYFEHGIPYIKFDVPLKTFSKGFKTEVEYIEQYPEYESVIKNMFNVTVNLDKAFYIIDNLQDIELKSLSAAEIEKYKKGEKIYRYSKSLGRKIEYKPWPAFQKKRWYKILALKAKLNLHFFKVSETGRIYTSLTSLPKEIKGCLEYNGKQLIELDAANCQPLLLSGIINNNKYKSDCECGIFYDEMAKQLGISREEFKLKSYEKIFFNNNTIPNELAKQLDERYGNISEQINTFKATADINIPEEDYLWFKLQKLEAEIFIGLAKELDEFVITRHDALLVLPDSVIKVKELLIEKFKQHNINVTIK